jgi:hypothetical protein
VIFVLLSLISQKKWLLMEEKELVKDVRVEVMNHLTTIERSMLWLANKADIKYPSLYSMLKEKTFNISEDNLKKINEVLGTSFTR